MELDDDARRRLRKMSPNGTLDSLHERDNTYAWTVAAAQRPFMFTLSLLWSFFFFAASAFFSITRLPLPPCLTRRGQSCDGTPRTRPRPATRRGARLRPKPTSTRPLNISDETVTRFQILQSFATSSAAAAASADSSFTSVRESNSGSGLTSGSGSGSGSATSSPTRGAGAPEMRRHPRASSFRFDPHVLGDVEESDEDDFVDDLYHDDDAASSSFTHESCSDEDFGRASGPGSLTPDGGASDTESSEAETDHGEHSGTLPHPKHGGPLHWFKRKASKSSSSSTSSSVCGEACRGRQPPLDSSSTPPTTTTTLNSLSSPSGFKSSLCIKRTRSKRSSTSPRRPSLVSSKSDPPPRLTPEPSFASNEDQLEFKRTSTTETLASDPTSPSSSSSSHLPAAVQPNFNRRITPSFLKRSFRSRSPLSRSPLASPTSTPPISPTLIPTVRVTHPDMAPIRRVSLDADVPTIRSVIDSSGKSGLVLSDLL